MAEKSNTKGQSTATANSNDLPPRTLRAGRYNMDSNIVRFLINVIPFVILAAWRYHFGQIYFWFPTQFATQYHPGWTCSTVQIPGGGMCEDVIGLKEFGMAILTCDSNRRKWNTVMGPLEDPHPKGQLILMDYKKSPPTMEILSLGIPETLDFHPLGAALYHSSRHSTLFVANAGRNGSSIELFYVSHSTPLKMTWERSISHPLIPNANAILPISATKFYVTNDHRFRRAKAKSAHILETYLQLPLSYTTFVDISEKVVVRKAVSLQRVANGIASTPDLETVFIAETARGGFGVYSRSSENDLKFQEFVRINGFTDNLHFDDDGYVDKDNWGNSSVIVGVHPNIMRLEKFVRNIQSAPSWIVSARPPKEEYQEDPHDQGLYKAKNYKTTWHVRTEFQDDGEWFGSATGAIVDKERGVMIGSGLYDGNGAFICRKK